MAKTLSIRLLIFQLLLLLPFLLICFFVWPSSDDYYMSYMMLAEGKSSFEIARGLFHSWGGRYATLVGAMLSPVVVGNLWLYRLLLTVAMVLLFFALRWFWSAVVPVRGRGLLPEVLSAGFLLLWLQVIPGMADSFYWHSGVVVYTWPLILFFFVAGALLRPLTGIAMKLAVSLAAFLMVGFNEMSALMGLLVAVLYIVPGIKGKKQGQHLWLLLAAVTGIAILMLSPGNAKRMELFTEARNIWQAVKISMVSLVKLNGIHLQNMPLWLSGMLLFPMLKKEYFNVKLHAVLQVHPLIAALAGQGLLLMLMFIPAWSMGINPPLRVYNFLSPLWLLAFWWLLATMRYRAGEKIMASWPVFKGAGLKVMFAVIALSFMVHFVKVPGGDVVFGGNVPQAWYDLVFRAPDYNRDMHERERLIREAGTKGRTKVEVPALQNPPRTIHFLDIQPDRGHWINEIIASHYGVGEVWVGD